MNREEFLKQLFYLLQDIPEEERKEALEYYEDYFEEAGPEREKEIIEELGSPEKIAMVIRDSVKGQEDDGEYTENGYYNKRYDEKNQMPKKSVKKESWHLKGDRNRNIILLVIIVVLAGGSLIPAVLGAVFGIGGGILGVAGGLVGIFLAAAGGCIGCIGGGLGMTIAGIVKMFTELPAGLMMTGEGILMIAAGLILLMIWVWIIGKVLPALVQVIVRLFHKIIHRGGETA